MNLEELKAGLDHQENVIRDAQEKMYRIRTHYTKENAKFKVGDRVWHDGWWLYSDPKSGKYSPPMFGEVVTVSLTEDLIFYYGVKPDDDDPYWRGYNIVYRYEKGLVPVAKVRIT